MSISVQALMESMARGAAQIETLIDDVCHAPLVDVSTGVNMMRDALPLLNNPILRASLSVEDQQRLEELHPEEVSALAEALTHLVAAQALLQPIRTRVRAKSS